MSVLLLVLRQHVGQLAVVGLWLRAASKAYFFGLSRGGYADTLLADRALFFTIVVIKDRILVAVDIETDLSFVKLVPEIVGIVKLLLRALAVFGEFEFYVAGRTKAILQVSVFFSEVMRRA